LKHYSKVYAWYYCFKHFIELDTLTNYIVKKRTEELDRIFPDGLRSKIFDSFYEEIELIKYNKGIRHQNQLAERIINSVLANPSGSCYFYEAELRPDKIKIQIGSDHHSLKVKDGSNLLFEFKMDSTFEVEINGCELTITDDKPYVFYSPDMWKVVRQVELYKFYVKNFGERVKEEQPRKTE
jgi:hypothetical protein